jgi:hypothetical protein
MMIAKSSFPKFQNFKQFQIYLKWINIIKIKILNLRENIKS